MSKDNMTSVSEAARHLIVWAAEAEVAAPIVAELRQGGELELLEELAEVPANPTDWPDAGILLLYLSPAETLCRAMRAGLEPSSAIADWQLQAQQILTLNRRNRRRVQLLDIGMVRAHPAEFRRHFQLAGGGTMEPLPQQDEILMLIARQLLLGDSQVKRLSNELDAISLMFGSDSGGEGAELDIVFREYGRLREMLEEADAQSARHLELETELAQAQEQLVGGRREWEATLAAARAEGQQAQREAELFQDRAGAAQDELEALTRRRQELERELELVKTESQRATREGELLQAQALFMKQELEQSVVEREQLEQRLQQLSQGMESYQAQLAGLEAERLALQRRAGEKERSLSAAGVSLRDMEAQLDHVRHALAGVEAKWKEAARMAEERQELLEETDRETHKLLSSKSFRLTAPLRFFRSLLS